MKNYSPLQIIDRLKTLSFPALNRKQTELESDREFYMRQLLVKISIKNDTDLNKSGCITIVTDSMCF